jgi:hypothetical protein
MKRIFIALFSGVLTVLLLIGTVKAFTFPIHDEHVLVSQLLSEITYDQGSWNVWDDLHVFASSSSKFFILELKKSLGRKDNIPLFKTIDTLKIPISDSEYIARGRYECYRKEVGLQDKYIVVLLHKYKPQKVWLVKNNKFHPISTRSVICHVDEN